MVIKGDTRSLDYSSYGSFWFDVQGLWNSVEGPASKKIILIIGTPLPHT